MAKASLTENASQLDAATAPAPGKISSQRNDGIEFSETIAVIGGSTLRTGFRLAGITQLYPAQNAQEAEKTLSQLLENQSIGIIIIEERMLEELDWRMKKRIEAIAKPVVVAVPGRTGPLEQSESIAKLVKRALGFDLMKNGKSKSQKNDDNRE